MTKCLEEEAGDHWEKGSSDVLDALHFIIYGDRVTNLLMAKRKVGLFSGFNEKSSLVQTIWSRAEEVDDPTLYQICFLFRIELNVTHPSATVCNFLAHSETCPSIPSSAHSSQRIRQLELELKKAEFKKQLLAIEIQLEKVRSQERSSRSSLLSRNETLVEKISR
jgi:hypothetical protein